MTHFYAFNGDADGLCALQQLRLADPHGATLVTGVKRDIKLLQRIDAGAGDRVTVLDISLDQNRAETLSLLAKGVTVQYFDHHFAGALPKNAAFESYIDEAADVCTSILVDRYLGGRYRQWAIAAAFGDSLPNVGSLMAAASGLDAETTATLRMLGTYLNYNAYGEAVSDLHFDPATLAESILPFADPIDFVAHSETYANLKVGYEEDMSKARQLKPARQIPGATILLLPNASWAKRAIGVFANELAQSISPSALAILLPNAEGGYVVSVRVPANGALGADEFCRRFDTGGGRKLAAGVNHLPEADVDRFSLAFETCFGGL